MDSPVYDFENSIQQTEVLSVQIPFDPSTPSPRVRVLKRAMSDLDVLIADAKTPTSPIKLGSMNLKIPLKKYYKKNKCLSEIRRICYSNWRPRLYNLPFFLGNFQPFVLMAGAHGPRR